MIVCAKVLAKFKQCHHHHVSNKIRYNLYFVQNCLQHSVLHQYSIKGVCDSVA